MALIVGVAILGSLPRSLEAVEGALSPATPAAAERASRGTGGPASRATAGSGALVSPTGTASTLSVPGAEAAGGGLGPEDLGPFPRRWTWRGMGSAIGARGLEVADLDLDGRDEIVVTGAGTPSYGLSSHWQVLRWTAFGYNQVWASELYPTGLGGIDVAQADEDSALEIVVAAAGLLEIHDGLTRQIQASFPITTVWPMAVAVGDVDADGALEAVVVDRDDLYVYGLESQELEAVKHGFGGFTLSLGQADDDPPLEIAVINGWLPGWVLDGGSLLVQWERTEGLGDSVAFGNLDADPHAELVTGWSGGEGLRAFDVESGSQLWKVPGVDVTALQVADVDGDGEAEVIYGGVGWGALHVLSGSTGVEESFVANPDWGIQSVAAGDTDGDGHVELVWGSGGAGVGFGKLIVADSSSRAVEWRSRETTGEFRALAASDLEGDGEKTLLASAWSSPDGDPRGGLMAFDLHRERAVPISSPAYPDAWILLSRIASGNLDGDGQDELCLANTSGRRGLITCYDGLSWAKQWQATLPDWLTGASMLIGDIDGDLRPEVVVGARSWNSSAKELSVFCFDGETGKLEWQSPALGGAWEELPLLRAWHRAMADRSELVVAKSGEGLFFLDGRSGELARVPLDLSITALDVAARSPGFAEEIFVGLEDGTIRVVDPVAGGATTILLSLGARVDALAVGDVSGSPASDFVVSLRSQLRVLDGASGNEIWRSGLLAPASGQRDSLLFADLDGDRRRDVVTATAFGVVGYLSNPKPSMPFRDGSEWGDLRRWSRSSLAVP